MRSNQIRTIQKRAKQRALALAIAAIALAGYGAISLFADDANAVTKTVTEMNKVPAIRSVGIRLISGSPPPMAEILNQSTHGKVSVKLSGDNTQSSPASAGVQEVQQSPSSKPPKPKKQLLINAHSNTEVPEFATVAKVEPIRVSLGDSGKSEVPTVLSVASAPTYVVKSRLPVLVKPMPTQITHTVSLAQSTEIDLPAIDLPTPGPSLDEIPTLSPPTVVVVKEQLASQSFDKTRADSRSNAEATPDGFVSLAPPSLPEFGASAVQVKQVDSATPPSKLDSRYANGSPSAIIELESQSAKAMDIPGNIKAITVENEDVCRILHDAKTISLVGNQFGSTLVQIWTNEAEAPLLVRVNVSQPWHKSNSKPTDVRDVKHAVAQAFPKANINVFTNADGTLEVRGTTDSEDSAKRILEIVRKICLVPVKDKVTVSR